MFNDIKYFSITELGLSQIYLNREKLINIEKWFNPNDLSNFQPLSVHNFGNGKLTLTDGHSRAFVAYKAGVNKIPIVYDTDDIVTSEQGQLLYKNDIIWCERFGLKNICDLGNRIISKEDYQKLWIDRCDKSYNLLTKTNELQRQKLSLLYPNLFLYGASEDLKTLFFENCQGVSFEIPLRYT